MYACAAENVGSVLEVRSGESAVRAAIREAFDPPRLDRDDRAPRTESYEKAFKPLPMGVLRLEQGRQPLALRCLKKAGPLIGEIRALKLKLLDITEKKLA